MTNAAQALLHCLTALSLLAATPAAGCIGPPAADLWDLVAEADEIVVADVRSVRPSTLTRILSALQAAGSNAYAAVERVSPDGALLLEETFDWPPDFENRSHVARLDVVEPLRGPATGTIEIAFGSWGALLLPGETVVVFLRRGLWSARLLDYRNSVVFSPGAEEVHDLRTAISAAIELQRHPGEAARREWAVGAASLPGSRPHVLGRLARQPLTVGDRRLLAESFVKFPTLDELEPMLAVLEGYRDPAFDRRAAGLISAALSDPGVPCWASSGMLEAMLTRLGKGDPVQDLYGCRDPLPPRRLWRDTLEELDVPAPGSAELAAVGKHVAWRQRLLTKLEAAFRP